MTESAVQDGELIPTPGRRLGRYDLVSRLARGGMAEVWLARQRGELGFTRIVALKMIRPEYAADAVFRNMFLDEARLAARLHHANAVEVLDLGETDRVLYLAMAYVEGESLYGLIQRAKDGDPDARLPLATAVRIVADVCAGLHAAHDLVDDDGKPLGLVHRDVSPHNVLVGLDGIARVTDFGIAKALGRLTDETETGHVKGKLAYLAPEQARRLPPDRRADVFAAGIVLWELLTGARLFKGEDVPDTLLNVSNKKIPDPRSVADVPDAIAEATLRALARDPSERFQTAREMQDALEDAARRSGEVASAKDVSAVVADLALADIERRRASTRSQGAATKTSPTASTPPHATARTTDDAEPTVREGKRPEATSTRTASVVPAESSRPAPARRAWVWAGAGAVFATVAWFMTRPPSSSTAGGPTGPTAPPQATERPAPPEPAPVATGPAVTPTAAASSADAAASASAPAPASPPMAAPKSSAKPSPEPGTTSVPSERPKYDNPYGP